MASVHDALSTHHIYVIIKNFLTQHLSPLGKLQVQGTYFNPKSNLSKPNKQVRVKIKKTCDNEKQKSAIFHPSLNVQHCCSRSVTARTPNDTLPVIPPDSGYKGEDRT